MNGGAWVTLASLSASTTSYTDSTVSRASLNQYQVIATSPGGNSQPSNVVSVSSAAVPSTPVNPSAQGVSDTEVNLTWDRVRFG